MELHDTHVVDSLHPDAFSFVRGEGHHQHHLPLPDFSSDESPPHFADPLSPKSSLKDLDDHLHSHTKPLFHGHNTDLLEDFIGASNSSSPGDSPNIRDSDEPHSLDVVPHHHGQSGLPLCTAPAALPPGGTTVIDGVTYNNRGYEVCGAFNKFNKPCQRIGRCPFHPDHKKTEPGPPPPQPEGAIAVLEPRRFLLPIKKGPYKSGWKKDEHLRFLKGLQIHGRGSWKDIALIVGTRTPTQIQVHAHRYYLRQQQGTKNKRSIHDISLEDLEELEVQHGSIMPGPHSPLPQLSPPSPDSNDSSHDISQLFQAHASYPHTSPHNHHMHSPPSPPSIHPAAASYPGTCSSTNFPPLFPATASSSLSNALPGLPPLGLPLPIPGAAPFSMNYSTSSWFPSSPFPPMNSLGDDDDDNSNGGDLAPLLPSHSHVSFQHDDEEDDADNDNEDEMCSHTHPHPHTHTHGHSHGHAPSFTHAPSFGHGERDAADCDDDDAAMLDMAFAAPPHHPHPLHAHTHTHAHNHPHTHHQQHHITGNHDAHQEEDG